VPERQAVFVPGDEDCLFLNVWAPEKQRDGPDEEESDLAHHHTRRRRAAAGLPVLVWIHGGGYGLGNGRQDMADFIGTNDNSIVGVSIQYRVSATVHREQTRR